MHRARRRSSDGAAGAGAGASVAAGAKARAGALGALGAGGGVGGGGGERGSPRGGDGGEERGGEAGLRPSAAHANWPALPLPATHDPRQYAGPTEESNWVLPRRLLVGAFPGSPDDAANERVLQSILELGITTFVCLQQEYQHRGVTEHEWRSGLKLRPYVFDAVRLLPRVRWPAWAGARPTSLEFVHFPIVDCGTASDARVLRLARDLCGRLSRGENLYVHCWGGHGRTGTVVSLMLGLAYDLGAEEAMAYVQLCHDYRACPMGVASPQTEEQRRQVRRILAQVQQAQQQSQARKRTLHKDASPSSSSGGPVASGSEEKEDGDSDRNGVIAGGAPGAVVGSQSVGSTSQSITAPVPPLRLEAVSGMGVGGGGGGGVGVGGTMDGAHGPRRSSLSERTSREPGHAVTHGVDGDDARERGKTTGASVGTPNPATSPTVASASVSAAASAVEPVHVARGAPRTSHPRIVPPPGAEPDHQSAHQPSLSPPPVALAAIGSPRGAGGGGGPTFFVPHRPSAPAAPAAAEGFPPDAPTPPSAAYSPRGRGRQLRVPDAASSPTAGPPSAPMAWGLPPGANLAGRGAAGVAGGGGVGGVGGVGGGSGGSGFSNAPQSVQTPGRHLPGRGTVPDPAATRAGRLALDAGFAPNGNGSRWGGAGGVALQSHRGPHQLQYPHRPSSGARRLLMPRPPAAELSPSNSPRHRGAATSTSSQGAKAPPRSLKPPVPAVQTARGGAGGGTAVVVAQAPALRRPSTGPAPTGPLPAGAAGGAGVAGAVAPRSAASALPAHSAPSLQQRLARDALLYGERSWQAADRGQSKPQSHRPLAPPVPALPGNTADRALAYHVRASE